MISQRADVPGSSRLGPSEIADIADEKALPMPQPPLGVFAIETAALTAQTVPAGHDPHSYGETSADWRPFPGQRAVRVNDCGSLPGMTMRVPQSWV